MRARPLDTVTIKKVLVSVVITICLGVQLFAIVRPSGAALWPFLDYPMYSRSHEPGSTTRAQALHALGCGERPGSWQIQPRDIGYQGYRLRDQLRAIIRDRPSAPEHREELSRAALRYVRPRPCALEVSERTLSTTENGVNVDTYLDIRPVPIARWSVDAPLIVQDLRP